jgi:hypothetical protein
MVSFHSLWKASGWMETVYLFIRYLASKQDSS